jgi:mRNA interferase MazF
MTDFSINRRRRGSTETHGLGSAGAGHAYPWRVPCQFQRRRGFVALDQLRTVDTERLVKRLGRLSPQTVVSVLRGLQEMFAE